MAAPAPDTPMDAMQGEGQQDDVQGELPEGTFVINAMAVQLAGIEELDTMVEKAYEDLSENMRKKGVDENLVTQLVGSSSITGTDDILTLYNDNSIFSQLVQKTAGFSIPFIFQPNKNYARPDGFMYAVIDQNSIEIEQIGVNLFRTSLRIKEVW